MSCHECSYSACFVDGFDALNWLLERTTLVGNMPMWEQLIRRQDRERLGIGFEQIESPFFAKNHVYQSLVGYGGLRGVEGA